MKVNLFKNRMIRCILVAENKFDTNQPSAAEGVVIDSDTNGFCKGIAGCCYYSL